MSKMNWQAENDASVLADYQEILGNKNRLREAIKVAKKRAKDLSTRASAMQSVARAGAKSYAKGGRIRKTK